MWSLTFLIVFRDFATISLTSSLANISICALTNSLVTFSIFANAAPVSASSASAHLSPSPEMTAGIGITIPMLARRGGLALIHFPRTSASGITLSGRH
jgi:hypothetical protein